METLVSIVPDVEVFLALAPEELAPILLRLARSNMQGGSFLPEQVTQHTIREGIATYTGSGYPRHQEQEVQVALGEAWQWLRLNMLIVPASGTNGQNGWMVFSRRGAKLANDRDFQRFREAAAFPKSMLHPSIADKIWLALARGDLDEAVFAAFKAVEEAVRDAGSFSLTDYGTELMRKAFKPGGPLSNSAQPIAEQEALANLFAGAIGSYKNPHSHRTISITDPREAQEMAMIASHLLRIVDARRPK
jgi:uncharacterized protein (TIGR02391 family)